MVKAALEDGVYCSYAVPNRKGQLKLYVDPSVDLHTLDAIAHARFTIRLFDTRDEGVRTRGKYAGKRALKLNLRPIGDTYRKQDPITGRRVWAVDWFGHRDFMRAVFELDPTATFVTMVSTWAGSEDFEARHRESAWRQEGSQMYPYAAAEASLNGGVL